MTSRETEEEKAWPSLRGHTGSVNFMPEVYFNFFIWNAAKPVLAWEKSLIVYNFINYCYSYREIIVETHTHMQQPKHVNNMLPGN